MGPQDQIKNLLLTNGIAYSAELAKIHTDFRKDLCRLRPIFRREGMGLVSKWAKDRRLGKIHIIIRPAEQMPLSFLGRADETS